MTLSTEQAARLVLAAVIRDAIDDRVEDIRSELRPELNPGDRTAAYVDGIHVGAVQMTQTKPATKVVDYGALMVWVMEHNPTALVTTQTVNRAWVDRIVKNGGEWIDSDGVVYEVPGLGVAQASPNLVVTKTDAARAWAQTALEAAMNTQPAITAGDTDV